MASYVLTNCKLWIAQFDISGDSNKLTVSHGAGEKDNSRFGGTATEFLAGLETVDISHDGFWNGGTNAVDDALFSRVAGAGAPISIAPTDGAAASPAYLFDARHYSYSPGAQVGEIFAFTAGAKGHSRLISGKVFEPGATARTSSFNSSSQQLGAVSATQKLYAALHVFSGSGTLDVVVQSDNGAGFSTPANQFTFTQATGRTSQWATPVSGAITDDWWRIAATIGGGSPSFTFAVTIGIR